MAPNDLTEITVGIAGWATLIWVVQFVLLPTAVDYLREQLFDVRRELVMLVAEGRLSADDEAYRRLRRFLNVTLQYAERITFWRMLVMALSFNPKLYAEPSIEEAVGKIADLKVRAAVRRLHQRTGAAISWHVVRTSPTAWVAMLVIIPITLARIGLHHLAALATVPVKVQARYYPVDRFEAQAETLACA